MISQSSPPPSVLAPPPPSLTDERPYPGPHSFGEDDQSYFFGRDAAIDALFGRVCDRTLTVLHGKSGLGKTSLLQAGLFPRLRKVGYCPMRILFDFQPVDGQPVPLADQIFKAISAAIEEEILDARPPEPGETLWHYFHFSCFWDADGEAVTPVLVLDQFEEVLHVQRRPLAAALMTQLGDLVENWIPAEYEEDVRTGKLERPDGPPRVKVILSLRDEFLAELDDYRKMVPSLGVSRMRLGLLRGKDAKRAVTEPGKRSAPHQDLVSDGVAEAILKIVEGPEAQSKDLADIEVESSLLALYCYRLNEARIAAGAPEVVTDLVTPKKRDDILRDFYLDSMREVSEDTRNLVEKHLINDVGRDTYAVGRLTPEQAKDVQKLVNLHLLRYESRLGQLHVELVHDVYVAPVRSCKQERERENERKQQEIQQAEERAREAERKQQEIQQAAERAREDERRQQEIKQAEERAKLEERKTQEIKQAEERAKLEERAEAERRQQEIKQADEKARLEQRTALELSRLEHEKAAGEAKGRQFRRRVIWAGSAGVVLVAAGYAGFWYYGVLKERKVSELRLAERGRTAQRFAEDAADRLADGKLAEAAQRAKLGLELEDGIREEGGRRSYIKAPAPNPLLALVARRFGASLQNSEPLHFSPDGFGPVAVGSSGHHVAVADADRTALWILERVEERWRKAEIRLPRGGKRLEQLQFSGDETRLFLLFGDSDVAVLDTEEKFWKPLRHFEIKERAWQLSPNHNGRVLVVRTQGTADDVAIRIHIDPTKPPRLKLSLPLGTPGWGWLGPTDSGDVIAGLARRSEGCEWVTWDLSPPLAAVVLTTAANPPSPPAAPPKEKLADCALVTKARSAPRWAVAESNNQVSLWTLEGTSSIKRERTLTVQHPPTELSFTDDGGMLLVLSENEVRRFDLQKEGEPRSYWTLAPPQAAAFHVKSEQMLILSESDLAAIRPDQLPDQVSPLLAGALRLGGVELSANLEGAFVTRGPTLYLTRAPSEPVDRVLWAPSDSHSKPDKRVEPPSIGPLLAVSAAGASWGLLTEKGLYWVDPDKPDAPPSRWGGAAREGDLGRRMTDVVTSGNAAVAAENDGAIHLGLLAEKPKRLTPIEGGDVPLLALSQDGAYAAVGADDYLVVYITKSGKEYWDTTPESKVKPVFSSLAVLSGSNTPPLPRVLAGEVGGRVYVWRTANDKGQLALRSGKLEHKSKVTAAVWQDPSHFATADESGTVILWQLSEAPFKAQAERSLTADTGVSVLKIEKNSAIITGEKDGTMQVWNAETGESTCRAQRWTYLPIRDITVHPNGQWALGTDGRRAALWDTATCVIHRVFDDSLYATFHAGKVVTFARGGAISFWPLLSKPEDSRAPLGQWLWGAFAGERLLASDERGAVFEMSRNGKDFTQPKWTSSVSGEVARSFRFVTSAGERAAAVSPGGKWAIWASGRDTPLQGAISLEEGRSVLSASLLDKGERLALVTGQVAPGGAQSSSLALQVLSTSEPNATPKAIPLAAPLGCEDGGPPSTYRTVTVASGKLWVLAVEDTGCSHLWNETGKALAANLDAPLGSAVRMALDGERGRLAVADEAGRLLFRSISDPKAHSSSLNADGSPVEESEPNKEDAPAPTSGQAPEMKWTPQGWDPGRHRSRVIDIAFHPAGRFVISADAAGVLWLWDAERGSPVGQLSIASEPVSWVAFTPDGGAAITGHAGSSLRLWETGTQLAEEDRKWIKPLLERWSKQ